MAGVRKQKAKAAKPWPADGLEKLPLAWFKPFEKNPKEHSEAQVKQIRASIEEFGWTMPILADESGEVIAGHGRLLAAALEPAFTELPTIVARGWSDAQKRAYRIADNKLTENGTWDSLALKGELQALDAAGFDLSLTGYAPLELGGFGIERFQQHEEARDPDAVPNLPKDVRVKPGELWLLGNHRLLIGDSCNKADVERLFKDGRKEGAPKLMVTDPPYGVVYDPNWRNSADRSTKIKGRKVGATAVGKVQNDDRADWREAWALFPGAVAYVWHAGLNGDVVAQSLKSAGFEIRSQIIWNKHVHIIGRGDYHWKHEPCWYAVRKGEKGYFNRDGGEGRKQNTVWDIEHRASETGHGTQKPLECMRRPILNNSKPGDGVYDPFCGSGTTLIACEQEKRRCYAMEIDPVYAQVIIERWQAFANAIAKREDGATLSSLKASKSKPSSIAKGKAKNADHSTKDGAARRPGKPVSRSDAAGHGRKRQVRKTVPDGQPAKGRGADRQPPVVDAGGNP